MNFSFSDFLNDNKKEKKQDIKKELEELKIMLESARNRFSEAYDSDLAEACIFEINSLNARYRYLLKCAKTDASA